VSSRRVLHVIDHLVPASGVASVVMLLVKGIRDFIQDVAIYGECDSLMKQEVIECGGRVYKLPDVTQQFGTPFAKSFSALLEDASYDVIHGHLLNSAFIYLRIAKRLNVLGRIIHIHSALGADTLIKRIRNKVLSKGVNRLASCKIAVSAEAARYAFGKDYADVHIMGNGVDTSRFKYNLEVRQQVRKELEIAEDVLCVGNVARFVKLKNHIVLLDVFKEMRLRTNSILVLVGEGVLEKKIKALVQAAGLSDYVRFLGTRHDVDRLYQAFDIFLLPSLSEGFGLAAAEAQCAGLGCVVSEHVPVTVKCSDRVRFLPLDDSKVWADTAISLAQQIRHDGSANVQMAGLGTETTCNEILCLYQSLSEANNVRH